MAPISSEPIEALLLRVPFFQTLDRVDLARLAGALEEVRLPAGTQIFSEAPRPMPSTCSPADVWRSCLVPGKARNRWRSWRHRRTSVSSACSSRAEPAPFEHRQRFSPGSFRASDLTSLPRKGPQLRSR